MSQLNTTVHVTDDSGEVHILEPGKDIPAELADKITNPKAWASDAPTAEEAEAAAAAKAAQKAADAAQKVADEAKAAEEAANQSNEDDEKEAAARAKAEKEASNAGVATVIPKKSNGSTEAWATYAKAAIAAKGLQIEIPAEAKRGEIIEALEGAGIATE